MISLTNISYKINESYILKNISAEVSDRSKVIGLVGPNGAGKTTLLKLISGLISDYIGDVFIDKNKLEKGKYCEWRNIISFIPDEIILYDHLSGIEFLIFVAEQVLPRNLINKKIDQIVNLFRLEGFIEKEIYKLSYGMKKRIFLASFFVIERDIIAMDEPFNGLDPEAIYFFKKMLKEESKKQFVIATHTLDIIKEIATDVFLISKGSFIRHINGEDIMNIESIYMEIMYE